MARYKGYKGKLRGRFLTTFTQDEVGTGNVNAMQIFLIAAKEIFHQYQPRVGE